MTTRRWEYARLDDAVLWVVYNDTNEEILLFQIESSIYKEVRLTVTELGKDPVVMDQPAEGPIKSLNMVGVGKREPGNDEDEMDLPPGLVVEFNTLPTVTRPVTVERGRRRA